MKRNPILMLRFGQVVNLDESKNKIIVKEFYPSYDLVEIPLHTSDQFQYFPKVGSFVLYFNFHPYGFMIIQTWAGDNEVIRMDPKFGLNEGDVQIQNSVGRNFINLDQNGNIWVVDGSMQGSITFDTEESQIEIKNYQVKLSNYLIDFIISKDQEIIIRKKDEENNILFEMIIDSEQNISLKTKTININLNNQGNLNYKVKDEEQEKFSLVISNEGNIEIKNQKYSIQLDSSGKLKMNIEEGQIGQVAESLIKEKFLEIFDSHTHIIDPKGTISQPLISSSSLKSLILTKKLKSE